MFASIRISTLIAAVLLLVFSDFAGCEKDQRYVCCNGDAVRNPTVVDGKPTCGSDRPGLVLKENSSSCTLPQTTNDIALEIDTPSDDLTDAADTAADSVPDLTPDHSTELDQSDLAETLSAPLLPEFPHLESVVDLHRGDVPSWVSLIYVKRVDGKPLFKRHSYGDSGDRHDFWPASTIKVYTATAALILLKELNMSLDSVATFYHDAGNGWVKDTEKSVRELIRGSITCSSNEDYTLLLRLAGLDWLNSKLFTSANGFSKTALMQGYVTSRPYYYNRNEPQRIVLKEGDREEIREHSWSKTPYADDAGCTVANSNGGANCSTPNEMSEHLRRLFFHEHLEPGERSNLRQDDLDWFRFGQPGQPVLGSTCTGGGRGGIQKVFPNAGYFHKTGSVSNYILDFGYVRDIDSDTEFILAIATKTSQRNTLSKLFEELARMVRTPNHYVHLAPLKDNVNPVVADLTIYSQDPATLDLIVSPFPNTEPPDGSWAQLEGTQTPIPGGLSTHTITSSCLLESKKWQIRGRLKAGPIAAWSDLHFVVVDAGISCL